MDKHKNPPKTIEEVGIHLGYMTGILGEIKDTLKDTPTRKEFDDDKLDLADHKKNTATKINSIKKNYVSKNEFKIGLSTVTVILGILVTILTLWRQLNGG